MLMRRVADTLGVAAIHETVSGMPELPSFSPRWPSSLSPFLTLLADSSFGRLDVALTAKTVVRHVCDSICGMPYMRLQSICAERCMFPSLVVAVCNAVSEVLQQLLICWGVERIVVALFTRGVCALRQRRRHFPGHLTDDLAVYTQDVE